jgi:hypothetical protein
MVLGPRLFTVRRTGGKNRTSVLPKKFQEKLALRGIHITVYLCGDGKD